MRRKICFQSIKSGAGEQFLLQDCSAKAGIIEMFSSQTPVSNAPSTFRTCFFHETGEHEAAVLPAWARQGHGRRRQEEERRTRTTSN